MSWLFVSALSFAATAQIGPAARPQPERPDVVRVAQAYPQPSPYAYQPAYSTPAASPWDTYKVRLTALARQQGVRESTIQSVIPGLGLNRRVIELDHAEPRTMGGGEAPSMAPYIRRHVTTSLIRRGQSNYSSLYQGLRWIESR